MPNLFIVATPIGNLEDITFRAIAVLREADLILCEDTRVTRKLLEKYNIKKPVLSYHEHSNAVKVDRIIDELKKNKNIVLVTDAGTPGISDPGNKLIQEIVRELGDKVNISPIPGASAVISALSVSGFPTDKFVFMGFPPHKKGRETYFKNIAEEEKTVAFYESPHRILKALEQLENYLDKNREMVVCRELTKMFETIYRGNLEKVRKELKNDKIKGEIVVVVRAKDR